MSKQQVTSLMDDCQYKIRSDINEIVNKLKVDIKSEVMPEFQKSFVQRDEFLDLKQSLLVKIHDTSQQLS